jgi:hypothetical protein
MKMHAYLREKLVNGRKNNEDISDFIPDWAIKEGVTVDDIDKPSITIEGMGKEIKRFAYFFFVPTLIYRDTYVRSRKIRIDFVIKNIFTFFILIFYIWSVFKTLCIPIFKNTV